MPDNVVHLHYGDANIDRTLQNPNYDTIQIETPPGIQLKNWADQNGYYFWFQNTAGGQWDGKKHYYPPFARQICVNGQMFDLEAQRLKCNEDMANFGSNRKYFENINQREASDPYQAVAFASRLSNLSGNILASEEANLSQAADNSSNPYFKIYLADVYTAQAMQPLVNQSRETGRIDVANPQTRQRLRHGHSRTERRRRRRQRWLGQNEREPARKYHHATGIDMSLCEWTQRLLWILGRRLRASNGSRSQFDSDTELDSNTGSSERPGTNRSSATTFRCWRINHQMTVTP